MAIQNFQAQFITDDKGKKTAVILPIEEFEELLEDLEDLAIMAERRDEPTIPFEEVMENLKRNGFLSNWMEEFRLQGITKTAAPNHWKSCRGSCWFVQWTYPHGIKKLAGSERSYRICIGDYRVVYEVVENKLIIEIVRVRHRKDVYR